MNNLNLLLKEIADKIPSHELINEKISTSSVGWHIEHMLLVINRIIMALEKSDPSEYRWQFNLHRLIIFNIRRIPRGAAKSPKSVVPKEFTRGSLADHLQGTLQTTKKLDDIAQDKFFVHSYFGNLKLEKAKLFLEIHTHHHLKIIRDIVKQVE